MDLRERFLSEARMLRKASSSRVVQVFDIGELPDGRPYFVMEFADRGTLADRIEGGSLPLPQALGVAADVARGVAELHRAGIVHRDIKPSNVLVASAPDGGERLLIADLGVAKNLAHDHRCGQHSGELSVVRLVVHPVRQRSASASPSTASSTKGCPAGGTAIPAGAHTRKTADLNGDGRADTLWLADHGSTRTLGVHTASGAGFSTTFSSASPISATAYAGRVSGGAIILLDTGRSAAVYTVIGCKIEPTLNGQGAQYTFDEGFTGYGSGAGCVKIGSAEQLVGYLAKAVSDGKFDVTRTTVDLSDGGRDAKNGSTVTLGRSLAADSPIVKTAQSVSCGSAKGVTEPS